MKINSHSKHPCDAVQKLQISPSLLFGVATRREAAFSAFVYHHTYRKPRLKQGNLTFCHVKCRRRWGPLSRFFISHNKKNSSFLSFPLSICFSIKSRQYSPSLPVVLIMRSCLGWGGSGGEISFSSSPFERL